MKRFALFALVLVLVLTLGQFAQADTTSGTVTVTTGSRGGLSVVSYDWLSDASGNVVDDTGIINGTLVAVETKPDSGVTSPSANYDIEVDNELGQDICLGLAANRSSSATESIVFMPSENVFSTSTSVQTVNTNVKFYPWQFPVRGRVTVKITNAGAANGGILKLYYKTTQ